MTQVGFFGETPAGTTLGTRQQLVFDALSTRTLSEDEAGALIHESRGTHGPDARCNWCASDGRHVLASLRRHKLVVRRHGGQWERRDVRPAPEQVVPHDPATAEIPF